MVFCPRPCRKSPADADAAVYLHHVRPGRKDHKQAEADAGGDIFYLAHTVDHAAGCGIIGIVSLRDIRRKQAAGNIRKITVLRIMPCGHIQRKIIYINLRKGGKQQMEMYIQQKGGLEPIGGG